MTSETSYDVSLNFCGYPTIAKLVSGAWRIGRNVPLLTFGNNNAFYFRLAGIPMMHRNRTYLYFGGVRTNLSL